jgi:hypothetical protein
VLVLMALMMVWVLVLLVQNKFLQMLVLCLVYWLLLMEHLSVL